MIGATVAFRRRGWSSTLSAFALDLLLAALFVHLASSAATGDNPLVSYGSLSAADLEAQRTWDALVTSLRSTNGIISNDIAPRYVPGKGRGLFALADIPEGTMVILSPSKVNLNHEMILMRHPEWTPLLAVTDNSAYIEALFVARVLKGLDTAENDPKKVLPAVVYQNIKAFGESCYSGIMAEDRVLAALPVAAREQSLGLIKRMLSAWKEVQRLGDNLMLPFGISRAEFKLALCHRYSRTFSDPEAMASFVPLLDWMNHKMPPTVDIGLESFPNHATGGVFRIYKAITLRAIKKGEELFDSYGATNTSHRFAFYGFHDPTYGGQIPFLAHPEIPLRLPSTPLSITSDSKLRKDAYFDLVSRLKKKCDVSEDGFILSRLLASPSQFSFASNYLGFIRGVLLIQSEFEKTRNATIRISVARDARVATLLTFSEVLEPLRRANYYSEENEAALWRYLAAECHRALSMIPLTMTLNSEDQVQRALLSQALSIGKEYRSVLESCVATFDSAAKR